MLCDSLEEDTFVITSGEDVGEKSASYLIPPTDIEKCEKKSIHFPFQWLLRARLQGEGFRHGSPGNSKTSTMRHATHKSQHMAARDQTFLRIIIKAICSQLIMQLESSAVFQKHLKFACNWLMVRKVWIACRKFLNNCSTEQMMLDKGLKSGIS